MIASAIDAAIQIVRFDAMPPLPTGAALSCGGWASVRSLELRRIPALFNLGLSRVMAHYYPHA